VVVFTDATEFRSLAMAIFGKQSIILRFLVFYSTVLLLGLVSEDLGCGYLLPEDGEGTKLNSEDEELALVGLSLTYSFILNTYNIITVTGKYNIYNTRALSSTRFPSVFQASIQRLRSTKAQIFLQA